MARRPTLSSIRATPSSGRTGTGIGTITGTVSGSTASSIIANGTTTRRDALVAIQLSTDRALLEKHLPSTRLGAALLEYHIWVVRTQYRVDHLLLLRGVDRCPAGGIAAAVVDAVVVATAAAATAAAAATTTVDDVVVLITAVVLVIGGG